MELFKIQKNLLFQKSFFLLGDNRDCSKDSRFLSNVGYVIKINLVGKAKLIFSLMTQKKEVYLNFGIGKKII